MKQYAEKLIDEVIRDEYGGCNPAADNPCKLKVRIKEKEIEVFVVGKWRQIRYYTGGNKIPSTKIMAQVESTVRCNTGTTFERKQIEWVWVTE